MGQKPEPLPFDNHDASDFRIFIQDWQDVVQRQLDRLDDGYWSDAYLLILAARHIQMASEAFAVHDPTGEVSMICREFEIKHPEVSLLRNMIMHFDEYYRGQGRRALGRRVFLLSYGRDGTDWIVGLGPWIPCNVSDLGRKAFKLAEDVLASTGHVEGWLEVMVTRGAGRGW